MKLRVWFFCVALLWSFPVWATTKTVCDSGCDNTTIAAALTAVGNGNHTITVQGTYTADEDITISQSGTSAVAPLTVQASGAQTVTSFSLTGDYIVVSGFTFDGKTGSPPDASVYVAGDYNTVQNCSFVNQTADIPAVMTAYTIGSYPTGVTIQNNTITSPKGHTFWVLMNNSYILHNTATDSGMDFIRMWGDNNLVHGNVVYNYNCEGENHPDFIQTWGADDSYTATNIVIDGNFVYNSCIQVCNLSSDGYAATLHDWTFRNNIYYHVGGAANVGIPNVAFYNNTFYDSNYVNEGHAIGFMGTSGVWAGTGGIVKNNIFISDYSNGWYAGDEAPTADYNYAATTTWGTKAGFSETHGVNGGNPYLVGAPSTTASNWALTDNSTILLNTGTTIASFAVDRDGTVRPQGAAWDIGAFEYGVTSKRTMFRH